MRRLMLGLAVAAVLAAPALASAPEPKRSVDPSRMAGRWYEIARLPAPHQKNCFASTFEWKRAENGVFDLALSCRKGSPSGQTTTQRAKARMVDPKTNAKMKVSFMGGLVSAEYRVLDRAEDYDWILLGTSGGNYLWLLSNRPSLPAASRQQAVARAKALGYDVGKLIYGQPTG